MGCLLLQIKVDDTVKTGQIVAVISGGAGKHFQFHSALCTPATDGALVLFRLFF
jgi:hypothetical protein